MGFMHCRRSLGVVLGLLATADTLTAQNMPPRPKPVPLPHPDLAAPAVTDPGPPLWLVLCGIALALGLTAFLLWLMFRKRIQPPPIPTPPLSRAQQRLQELLKECDALAPHETAHRVSVILRDYQEGRYLVPAPFRTREELYEHGEFNARGPARERFSPIAQLCDQIAFAPAPATRDDAETLIQQALEALQQETYHVADRPLSPPKLPPPIPPAPAVAPPPLP